MEKQIMESRGKKANKMKETEDHRFIKIVEFLQNNS